MNEPKKIAVFQTAFLGDVVLTLPLIQALHEKFPAAAIIPVTIPAAASMLRGHPAVSKVLEYDKRGSLRRFCVCVPGCRHPHPHWVPARYGEASHDLHRPL